MKNDFDKFKKKVLMEHLVYSLLLAFCVGLVFSGLALMILILTYKKAPAFSYPLIVSAVGVVAAVISFVFLYRRKKPSDDEIALRIDDSLGMQEKVATMVEFKNEDSLLINKQREDATERLSKKTTKALPVKLHVWTLPIIVVCGGLFAASFFTPSKDNPFVDIYSNDKNDDHSKIIDDKTDEIIEDIKGDIDDILDPDEDFHKKLDDILDDLNDDLKGDTDPDSRQDKIDDAKEKIDEALDEINTNDKIGDALSKSDDDALKMLGEAIQNNDVEGIDAALEKLKEEINELSGSALQAKLQQIADQIRTALENSEIPEGDPTRDALEELADALEKLAQEVGWTKTDDEVKEEASKIIDEIGEKLKESAEEEKKNEEAAEKVKEEMDQMKDPTAEEEKNSDDEGQTQSSDNQGGQEQNGSQDGDNQSSADKESGSQSTDKGDNNGENGNDDATQGSGSTKYAGDDKVYTPDGGSQEYSEVIEKANNEANEDNASVSEESGEDDISDILEGYYKYLYGDDDSGNNP